MSFILSNEVNPSKVFLEQKANILGRWDPFYFQPELVELEKRVRKATSHCLRDFVLNLAGGSTPSRSEEDLHYSNAIDGVPFLRVQNITEQGLDLSDVKYVTRNTHEGLLKRSQVTEGNLLITITGRIASAAVAPCGFEGNINQHSVVIKTASNSISETLAAFFNLGIVNKLAIRRSTGGTRPALDYPALLSIPVIFDERISTLMSVAIARYQTQVINAKELLASIDDILLDELGIPCNPEPPNTIESRIFKRSFSEVSGNRFDPIANQEKRRRLEESIHSGCYPVRHLRELVFAKKTIVDTINEGDFYIGLENISGETGEFFATTEKESVGTAVCFEPGQILFPKLRPYLNKVHLAKFKGICSTEFHVFTPKGINGDYLTAFLRSRAIVGITSLLMTGNTLPRLQTSDIEQLPIPVPSLDIQQKLCSKIGDIRARALAIREQSSADFDKAKLDIEAIILGKEVAE